MNSSSLVSPILDGAAEATQALHAHSIEHWKALIEHAIEHEADDAPPQLVDALMALDPDPESWLRRAKQAAAVIESERFSTIARAMRSLRPWLVRGMAGSPVAARSVAFVELLADTSTEAPARARAFVEALGADAVSEALRPRALMLLARRALEAGSTDEASGAARAAEAIYAGSSREASARAARRIHGAALLRAGRLEEGLAALDELLDSRPAPSEGSHVLRAIADPREAALDELAALALTTTRSSPSWVRALGEVAETHADTEQADSTWAIFEVGLRRLEGGEARASENALRELMRQAHERELPRTQEAANVMRPLRGVASHGLGGAHLLLRVRDGSGRWLRVHEDATLEIARGDARSETARAAAGTLPMQAPHALAASLHRHLEPRPLTSPSPWSRFYPVQAFRGTPEEFVEGYVGLESEMGAATDVFGLRGGDARAIADALRVLLEHLPAEG